MTQKPEIIIEIDETGEIKIEVNCVKGRKCVELTDELAKMLGTTTNVQKKSEYYQPSFQPTKQKPKVKVVV